MTITAEKITIKEMIELLNNDLMLEYSAGIQYIQHSAVMTGPQYGDIITEMKLHATQEFGHAQLIAEQISFLGGTPVIDVGPRHKSHDNVEMLEQDLAGENDAINRYKQRIAQAEQLHEYALSEQLRDILAVEHEHAADLMQALGR